MTPETAAKNLAALVDGFVGQANIIPSRANHLALAESLVVLCQAAGITPPPPFTVRTKPTEPMQ